MASGVFRARGAVRALLKLTRIIHHTHSDSTTHIANSAHREIAEKQHTVHSLSHGLRTFLSHLSHNKTSRKTLHASLPLRQFTYFDPSLHASRPLLFFIIAPSPWRRVGSASAAPQVCRARSRRSSPGRPQSQLLRSSRSTPSFARGRRRAGRPTAKEGEGREAM